MKNKKKIIICTVVAAAILAVGILAGVLIGKSGADKKEEAESSTISTTTTANTTTTEDSTTTTDMPTSKKNEQNSSVTVVEGSISNTDKNNFRDTVGRILANGFWEDSVVENGDDFGYKLTSYDYKSTDAKRYAYSHLLYGVQPLIESYKYIYNYHAMMEKDYESNDPKGLLEGEYYCVEAEDVDFLLETTFNVKPDHNYILRSKDGMVQAYYHDGKYYVCVDEGGAGKEECRINTVKIQDDGKYLIYGTYYSGFDMEKVCDVKVVAEMKNVKGISFWSIYKIEKA